MADDEVRDEAAEQQDAEQSVDSGEEWEIDFSRVGGKAFCILSILCCIGALTCAAIYAAPLALIFAILGIVKGERTFGIIMAVLAVASYFLGVFYTLPCLEHKLLTGMPESFRSEYLLRKGITTATFVK